LFIFERMVKKHIENNRSGRGMKGNSSLKA